MTETTSHLVYELLHTGLQTPHLKLDSHQFVRAHDGFLGVPPALLKNPPRCLVGLEISQILQ